MAQYSLIFAQRLKTLCSRRYIPLDKLGGLTNIPYPIILEWERGGDLPTLVQFYMLVEALSLSENDTRHLKEGWVLASICAHPIIVNEKSCPETFGEVLREMRKQRNMTLQQMEGLSGGIGFRTVSRWENGESVPANTQMVEAVFQAFSDGSLSERKRLMHAYVCDVLKLAGL